MMLIVNVQTTDDLAPSIMANSSVKVMARSGTHQDYERMGRSMGMTREQIEWAKRTLRPGLYVAKVGTSDFQEPFLLRVPTPARRQPVSDAQAWESGEELRREVLDGDAVSHAVPLAAALPLQFGNVLTDDETAFVEAVRAHPHTPTSRFAGILGIGSRKAVAIRRSLVRKGSLKEWNIELSAKGARTMLLERVEDSAQGRRGSLPHRLGVDLARKRLEAEGYATETEKAVRIGKDTGYIDLVGTHGQTGETVGVEVETGESDPLGNLCKALAAGLDRVVMVACSRKVDRALQEGALAALPAEDLARVTFSTLSDYWDESCD